MVLDRGGGVKGGGGGGGEKKTRIPLGSSCVKGFRKYRGKCVSDASL